MRLAALLCLVVSSTASAQSPLFPGGTGPTRVAAPHWRFSAGGGLSGALTGVATLGLERTVSGPFAVGARGVLYTSGGFVDDGGGVEGVSADVVGSVGTRDRVADLRAFAGAGASVVRYYSGGLEVETRQPASGARALRPHLVGGVGVDVYPFAGVGVGIEVRGVVSAAGPYLSAGELGLRVRLAR